MSNFNGRGQTDWSRVPDVELKKFVDRYPHCKWISNGGCTDNGCIWHPDNHGERSPSGTVYYHTSCRAVVDEAKAELDRRRNKHTNLRDYLPMSEHFILADEEAARKIKSERVCLFTLNNNFQFYTGEDGAHVAAAILKSFKNKYSGCEFKVRPVHWGIINNFGNDLDVVYQVMLGDDSFFTIFLSPEQISERNKFRDEVHRIMEENSISDAKVPIIPALSTFDVFSA